MATSAKTVSGTLPQANSGTVDLTSSGFGTVSAAVIFVTVANSTSNPAANLQYGIGFWDGTNDISTASWSEDGQASSDTDRMAHSTDVRFGQAGAALSYDVTNITDGIRLTKTAGTASVDYYVSAILIGGALNAGAAVFNMTTGTGAKTVTPGFKADLVFIGTIGGGSDDDAGTNAIHSFGIAHNNSSDVVTQGAMLSSSYDAQPTMVTNSAITHTYCVGQLFNNAIAWQASASNFTSTTFDLTPTATAGNDRVYYLAVELADADDAWVDVIDAATSTGTDAHTGVGFQPAVVGLFSEQSTALDTIAQSRTQSFGASDSTTSFTHFYHDEDAAADSNANSEYSSSEILHVTDDAGTDDYIATLSSLDSDGFTLNYSDAAAGASKILALAINGESGSSVVPPGLQGIDNQFATITAHRLGGVLQ